MISDFHNIQSQSDLLILLLQIKDVNRKPVISLKPKAGSLPTDFWKQVRQEFAQLMLYDIW